MLIRKNNKLTPIDELENRKTQLLCNKLKEEKEDLRQASIIRAVYKEKP